MIIAVLFAALVVPLVIDWNAFRPTFEREAEKVLGQTVHVDGDVTLRILPMPFLEVTDIRVGGSADQPMLEIARFSTRVELIPLLTGDIRVAEMTIDRPVAAVTVDETGAIDWLKRSAASQSLDPAAVTLQHVTVRNGAVSYLDSRSGRVLAFTSIEAGIDARSLLGPWKVEGNLAVEGQPTGFRLATGTQEADGSIRAKLDLYPTSLPITASADGVFNQDGRGPLWGGTFTLAEVLPPTEEGKPVPPPGWRALGSFELRPDLLRLPELTLAEGPEDRPFSLTGAATIALGADMRFDAVLKSRQVDLDRSLGKGPNEPVDVNAAGAALVTALSQLPRPPIPGRVGFDVPGIVVGGSVVQNLQFDAATDRDGWRIEELAADLPGRTRLSADGTVTTTPTVRFVGGVRLRSDQPSIFAAWWRGAPTGTRLPLQPFDMSGQLDVAPEEIRISGMTARMDESNIRGGLDWRRDASGRRDFSIDLKADRFDYDQAASLTELFAGRSVTENGGLADSFKVKLAAGSFVIGDTTLADVSADGSYAEGVLVANRFHVGDLAGAAISASGKLADLGTLPSGQLSATIDARDMSGLASVVERVLPESSLSAWLSAAAPALRDTKLTAVANAAATDERTNANITLNGIAGGSSVDVALGLTGAVSDWRNGAVKLSAAVENPDAGVALRQAGFAARDVDAPGPLRLTVEGGGPLASGVPLSIKGAIAGVDYDLEGRFAVAEDETPRFAGTVALSGADAATLVALVAGPVPGLGAPAALEIGGPLDIVPTRLALTLEKGRLGAGEATGSLVLAKAGERWGVDGDLTLASLDLGALAGFGLGLVPEAVAGGWSDAPFASPAVSGLDAAIGLKAATLTIASGIAVENAIGNLNRSDGRLDLSLAAGTIAGGAATGALSITPADGAAGISGQFAIKGGRLGDFVWQTGGKPVLSGPLDLSAQFEGSGRSLAGVVATLSGGGSIGIGAGSAAETDPGAFAATVAAAESGRDLDEAALGKMFSGFLDAAPLAFSRVDGAFSIVAGIVRAPNLDITADGATVAGGLTIDLNDLSLASRWTLAAVSGADEATGALPQVSIAYDGPLSAPERSLDVSPLQNFLQLRAAQREMQRIEKLQSEILEKEKLGRLLRAGRDEDRRKAEAEKRAAEAAAAAAEAERKAAEEEAVRAEAERLARAEAERQAAAEAQRQAEARAAEEAQAADEARRKAEEARIAAEAAEKAAAEAKARAEDAAKKKAAADALVKEKAQGAKDAAAASAATKKQGDADAKVIDAAKADAEAAKAAAEAEAKANADAIRRAQEVLKLSPEHLQGQ
ncbi:uncharacterized protein involved in outer membrane biogenesis [Kaistia geumhonensis]|uniref:Uncharacterized protein involved in outer membrane biogenesis n=1 Tax=Kaistia geumhonensis TaxID=410839 RepID=A0ABU0MC07_9HYPH|nr:uncharacterized protein involved in outer membrane biogenesis [Kaistia geumhonensis]